MKPGKKGNSALVTAELTKANTIKITNLNLGRKSKWLSLKMGIQEVLNMLILIFKL